MAASFIKKSVGKVVSGHGASCAPHRDVGSKRESLPHVDNVRLNPTTERTQHPPTEICQFRKVISTKYLQSNISVTAEQVIVALCVCELLSKVPFV